jgi:hypothetical protein
MNIREYIEYVTLEEGQLLKKLEYNDELSRYYDKTTDIVIADNIIESPKDMDIIPAPTLNEAKDWLLYKHNIYCNVHPFRLRSSNEVMWTFEIFNVDDAKPVFLYNSSNYGYNTYHKALHIAIENALQYLLDSSPQ